MGVQLQLLVEAFKHRQPPWESGFDGARRFTRPSVLYKSGMTRARVIISSIQWKRQAIRRLVLSGLAEDNGALQRHPFEFSVKCLTLDAKNFGGATLVSASGRQHAPDLVGFGIGQSVAGGVARLGELDRFANRRVVDAALRSHNSQPLDHVLQLAHVSRPAIVFQNAQSGLGKPGLLMVAVVVFLQEVM